MGQRVVIVGGVAAGPKTAARLRRLDPEAEITILEKGEFLSYAGCGTPYFVGGEIAEARELMATPMGVVRDGAFFRAVKGVTARTRTLAERIDRGRKVVHALRLEDGERLELPYDRLVLATGSSPARPPIPGSDLAGVHVLGSLEDALSLKEDLGGARRVTVVGGGLVGLECAEAFARRGAEITVVEARERVLSAFLDPEMAAVVERHLASKGVRLLAGTEVKSFEGDGAGRLRAVRTSSGSHEADLALLAVGARPNTALAREAGIAVGPSGGIAVDGRMATSDPSVFAAGDCVECTHLLTGEKVLAPMGSAANRQGRVAADAIAGRDSSYPGVLGTVVVKVFDAAAGATGLSEGAARRAGFDVVTAVVPGPDHAHYYPGSRPLVLKGVADRKTGRLLGVQAAGEGEASKRIDTAAMAIASGRTVGEVAMTDLAYAPPFASALDNLVMLCTTLSNKIDGTARGTSAAELAGLVAAGTPHLLLDVRSGPERSEGRIDHPADGHIPLGQLRERLGELPRDREIVAYCKTSHRAYEAQRILAGAGFARASFLDGGIAAWPYGTTRG